MLAPVVKEQRFGASFALIVTGSRSGRIDVAPVFLMLRMDVRIAINFRCRRLENLRLHPLRKTEHVDGTMNAGLGRLHRVALVVNGRSGAREVVDFVDFDVQRKCHVVPGQFEMLVVEKVLDIFSAAGEKIVDAKNVATRREQAARKGASQETPRLPSPKAVVANALKLRRCPA